MHIYRLFPLLLLTAFLWGCVKDATESPQWVPLELTFESSTSYDNPFQDVDLRIRLVAPSGSTRTVDAFWDGVNTWRARISPEETGEWSWVSECSNTSDGGLHNRSGAFRSIPYTGENPVYKHGPLRLSGNRRFLVHDDGTEFFWMGDTAWNGVLRSVMGDWQEFLRTRREQQFNVIQFVSTHWRGLEENSYGETAFQGRENITITPRFFQRMDPKVTAINEHGLVAAPVVLWTLTESDPGQILAENDAVRLARYIKARWGAHSVVWLIGGDGRYPEPSVSRWKRIGQEVFDDDQRLATLHPSGRNWLLDRFGSEDWYDIAGYQSSHGDGEGTFRMMTSGPPASEWNAEPIRPIINLEPNYEFHPGFQHGTWFNEFHVRRACYWSILAAPPAGVTYGTNPIWVWNTKPALADGHSRLGIVGPWREGLYSGGTRSMTMLRKLFESLPWTELRPAPEFLAVQPGDEDAERFVSAAASSEVAVFYAPRHAEIVLSLDRIGAISEARWYNPRSGEFGEPFTLNSSGAQTLETPNDFDWVLLLNR